MILSRRKLLRLAAPAIILPGAAQAGWLPLVKAGASPTTTWNTTPQHGGATFSNGNLTATGTASGAWNNVYSVASHSTGKFYAEFKFTTTITSGWTLIGVGSATFTANANLGSGTPSVGWANGGQVFINGSGDVSLASVTYVANDNIAMAVDFGASRIWFKNVTSGSSWNGVGGDPVAGTGGIDISGLSSAPFFAGGTIGFSEADVIVANFGATAYAQSAPSGYANW